MDADACAHGLAFPKGKGLLIERNGGFAGAQSMVTLGFGRIPEREDGITDEFDHGAVLRVNAVFHHALEIFVHGSREFIGVHAFGRGGEPSDVGKQNGDFLFFSPRLQKVTVFSPQERFDEAGG